MLPVSNKLDMVKYFQSCHHNVMFADMLSTVTEKRINKFQLVAGQKRMRNVYLERICIFWYSMTHFIAVTLGTLLRGLLTQCDIR